MTGQGCSHGWALEGIGPLSWQAGRPTHWRARPSQLEWFWAGMVTCGKRLWGRLNILPNSIKWRWRQLTAEKLTFNYLATVLVDIPVVRIPNARSLKTWDICGIVLSDKMHILEWPFIVPSTRCTFVMIMLFNQLIDMPHYQVDGYYLGKGEMPTNRNVSKFVHNIWEK